MPMPSMGMVGSNSTTIDVIDASNMKVVGKINVGARSPHGIALSSEGKKLWVNKSNQWKKNLLSGA